MVVDRRLQAGIWPVLLDKPPLSIEYIARKALLPSTATTPASLTSQPPTHGRLLERYILEHRCNLVAWRIALLNESRLSEEILLLQRAVDEFRRKFWSAKIINNDAQLAKLPKIWFELPRRGRLAPALPEHLTDIAHTSMS